MSTLAEDFGVVPGLLRPPASTPRPKSGKIGYQEKEEITGFQKNIGSVKSKTGTPVENAARAISAAVSAGRPDSKWVKGDEGGWNHWKEEGKYSQKNADSVKSKTSQGSGTLEGLEPRV